MFDLLFIGNPAIDKAIAEPEDMPQSLVARLRGAPLKTLAKTYRLAIESQAQGIVLCGSIMDPARVSPAQLVALRQLIIEAADHDCETMVTAIPTWCPLRKGDVMLYLDERDVMAEPPDMG